MTSPVTQLRGQAAVPRDITLWEWISDPATWTGPGGIWESLAETVVLCGAVVAVAILIAVPLAAWLAHYRRGEIGVTWMVTLSRAVPAFAIAGLLVPVSLVNGWGFEPWPIFIALLLLALPPIYLNTYTAVRGVAPGAVDAARAMGFSERRIMFDVELALATTLIFAGIRVSAVQVVATEPIRAFLGGDGMGRYVRDGLGQNNDTLLVGGAILIATLAALTGLAFGLLERSVLPYGVRRLKTSQAS